MRGTDAIRRFSIAAAMSAFCSCASTSVHAQAQAIGGRADNPLGVDIAVLDAALAKGWSLMYARHLLEGGPQEARWRSVVEQTRELPESARLAMINRYVNTVPYRSDKSLRGTEDFWQTPAEFFRLGGDCEDYATAKFFILLEAGFVESRMRILILRPTLLLPAHAVLMVETEDGPAVLDNLRDAPYPLTAKISSRLAFAVNETEMWVPYTVLAGRR